MSTKRQNASSSSVKKRTRFASPPPGRTGEPSGTPAEAADDLLEEDLPQGAQAAKSRSRRQIKDVDGYGSDSSNDEEGVVPSRRPGAKDEDDDVDMFADEAEDKDKGKGKGKEKEKEFMSLDEIEGQEFDRKRGGSSTAGEESDDESMAAKRKQGLDGDMGIDLTPFNMKSEMEEGRFTADGEAYIENDKDPNDKHDMWLEDLDEEAIRKARKAHKDRERIEREREEKEEEDGGAATKEKENDLLRNAAELMERGETILEALQRLAAEDKKRKSEAGGKKRTWAEKQKERKAEAEAAKSGKATNPFTRLSDIVSDLTAIGHLDVYSLSRESIQRMLPAPPPPANGDSAAPAARAAPSDDRKFQYRFSMKYLQNMPEAHRPVERETFGPFAVAQLKQWRNTGFFGGPACENVELRLAPEAGKEATSWGPWEQVVGP